MFPGKNQDEGFISMFSLTFHEKKEHKESFIEELVPEFVYRIRHMIFNIFMQTRTYSCTSACISKKGF